MEPRGICLQGGVNNGGGKLLVSTKCAVICIDLEKQETYMIAGTNHKFGFKDGIL